MFYFYYYIFNLERIFIRALGFCKFIGSAKAKSFDHILKKKKKKVCDLVVVKWKVEL